MKTVSLIAFASLLSGISVAQNETITGNGKIETRNVAIKSFSEIKASGVYNLVLTQGNEEKIKMEGDANLLDFISVKNDGAKLVIDTDKMKSKNIKGNNKLTVYVTFKNIDKMDIGTVGNVRSNGQLNFSNLAVSSNAVGNIDLNMTSKSINVKNKGVGNVSLKGSSADATVINSGVGSIHAGDFVVQTMNIQNNGVGSAQVNVTKDIKVTSNGLGSVKNRGAAVIRRTKKSAEI